ARVPRRAAHASDRLAPRARLPQWRSHRDGRRRGQERGVFRGRHNAAGSRAATSVGHVPTQTHQRTRRCDAIDSAARAARGPTGPLWIDGGRIMMIAVLLVACAATLAVLSVLVIYEWVLAISAALPD